MEIIFKKYGWLRDLPDRRDHSYMALTAPAKLPSRVDLRSSCPEIYNQGQLGSCTANAIGAAVQFERNRQKLEDFIPSRLFIYFNERVKEHTIHSDSGAQIRDGIKVVAALGACPEQEWPYIIDRFTVRPPKKCYDDALKDRAVEYSRISQNLDSMKSCLSEGFPFVFGFSVYESFEGQDVAASGVMNLPSQTEKMLGGHAVMAVGYDDSQQRFIIRNSWGSGWGSGGYFTMPYDYLTNSDLAADLWTVRLIASE